jgi:hypothetical protein
MNTVIWNKDDGKVTFAIKFKNGNYAEYVAKTFDTVEEVEVAIAKANDFYGENWSKHNLAYARWDDNGEKTQLYIQRNGN